MHRLEHRRVAPGRIDVARRNDADAARQRGRDIGQYVAIPQRQTALVAKQAAEVDLLTEGRFRLGIGLGWNQVEYEALGQDFSTRGRRMDEQVALLRRYWTERSITFEGEFDRVTGAGIAPLPLQRPIPLWFGGGSKPAFRRMGRLADGWLPSFITPDDAAAGRTVIEHTLLDHGRHIDDDHYGVLIPFTQGSIPDAVLATLAARRPDLADPSTLVPTDLEGLCSLIERFIEVGTTKFVVLPLGEPEDADAWGAHLDELAAALLPLERTLA